MNDNKVYWRCSRRGMLELDVFLTEFFHHHYKTLSAIDQQTFIELLEEDDPKLFAWLLGSEQAPEKYLHLCKKINANVQQVNTVSS